MTADHTPGRPSVRSSASRCPPPAASISCRRPIRTRSTCTARCTTAPATRSPTRSSRSGSPTRTAGSPQAEGSLRRDGWTFTGFGRAATDGGGRYTFTTVRPATGFISMTVFARGLLDRLFTRVYLPDPGTGVAHSPFLDTLPAERRSTLVAQGGDDDVVFDIHLQGERETVFLDFGA